MKCVHGGIVPRPRVVVGARCGLSLPTRATLGCRVVLAATSGRSRPRCPRPGAFYNQSMSRAADLRRFLTAGGCTCLTPRWRWSWSPPRCRRSTPSPAGRVSCSWPGRAGPHRDAAAPGRAVWWLFSALLIAGLLVRRRWPLALILAGAGAVGHQLDLNQTYLAGGGLAAQPIDLAVLIILFTLASHARTRRASAIALGTVLVGAYAAACVAVALHPNATGTPSRSRPAASTSSADPDPADRVGRAGGHGAVRPASSC